MWNISYYEFYSECIWAKHCYYNFRNSPEKWFQKKYTQEGKNIKNSQWKLRTISSRHFWVLIDWFSGFIHIKLHENQYNQRMLLSLCLMSLSVILLRYSLCAQLDRCIDSTNILNIVNYLNILIVSVSLDDCSACFGHRFLLYLTSSHKIW